MPAWRLLQLHMATATGERPLSVPGGRSSARRGSPGSRGRVAEHLRHCIYSCAMWAAWAEHGFSGTRPRRCPCSSVNRHPWVKGPSLPTAYPCRLQYACPCGLDSPSAHPLPHEGGRLSGQDFLPISACPDCPPWRGCGPIDAHAGCSRAAGMPGAPFHRILGHPGAARSACVAHGSWAGIAGHTGVHCIGDGAPGMRARGWEPACMPCNWGPPVSVPRGRACMREACSADRRNTCRRRAHLHTSRPIGQRALLPLQDRAAG